MAIVLTDQQQRDLDAAQEAPPRVIDPRTSTAYVLDPVAEYEAIREAMDEKRRQRAIHAVGCRNAGGRMDDVP